MDSLQPLPPEQTLALVREAQTGNGEAAGRLVERLSEKLLALAMVRLGAVLRRRVDPEDLVQEMWIEAFRSLHTFDTSRGTPFASWLATILRRILHRIHERERRLPMASTSGYLPDCSDLAPEISAAIASPSRQAHRDESLERLVAAVEKLPPDQRELVELYWFEDLPAAEVAERTGRSRQAVYMVVSRANRVLAAAMRGLDGPEPAAWQDKDD